MVNLMRVTMASSNENLIGQVRISLNKRGQDQ